MSNQCSNCSVTVINLLYTTEQQKYECSMFTALALSVQSPGCAGKLLLQSPPGFERWFRWVKLGLRFGLDHLHRQLQRVQLLHFSLVLPLPTLSLAALTMSSRPTIRFYTIPSFQVLRFRDSSLMITTSPTDRCGVCSPPQRRCLSRRPRRYSLVHLDHTASLQRRSYLALDRRSGSWI